MGTARANPAELVFSMACVSLHTTAELQMRSVRRDAKTQPQAAVTKPERTARTACPANAAALCSGDRSLCRGRAARAASVPARRTHRPANARRCREQRGARLCRESANKGRGGGKGCMQQAPLEGAGGLRANPCLAGESASACPPWLSHTRAASCGGREHAVAGYRACAQGTRPAEQRPPEVLSERRTWALRCPRGLRRAAH